MKTTLLFFVLIIFACCQDEDTKFQVAPELETYVESFYNDAHAAGMEIPRNLIAGLKMTQSTSEGYKDRGQNYFYFNSQLFNATSDERKFIEVYDALSGLFLHKDVYPFIEQEGQKPVAKTFTQIRAEVFN